MIHDTGSAKKPCFSFIIILVPVSHHRGKNIVETLSITNLVVTVCNQDELVNLLSQGVISWCYLSVAMGNIENLVIPVSPSL